MSNLIPADKLISEIEMRIAQWQTYTFACASQIASEAFDRIDELKGLLIYITSLQQEQPEVDLDALVNEAFDKYSSIDGYGQLAVSFNRAELYSFIKKITRKEETK